MSPLSGRDVGRSPAGALAERRPSPAWDEQHDGIPSSLGPNGTPHARRARTGRPWLSALVAYFVVQGLQLAALFAWAPRFFWLDDSQTQFGPMAWWLGRNLRGGRPPLMDPDQGMAGNLTADMQYGVLDPLHWVLQRIASLSDDFIVMSWVFASVCLLLLGTGSLLVLLHHRVKPALAVAGAIGVASSGILLWYGSSWWPLMWSAPWLPWLWIGLASRRWPGALVAGVATWALLASGNPYAVPFAVLIVAGHLLEQRRRLGSLGALLDPGLVTRLVACLGGVVVALPTLLTTMQLSPFMGRMAADPLVGNTGFAVTNFADVVVGGMTLLGQTNFYGGSIGLAPAMATAVIALPLLAFVRWNEALRAPGVVTALIVCAAGAIATQLPTTVSVFRYPIRYLLFVQLFLPFLALIAVSAAPKVDKSRLGVAAALVASQFALAQFRSPGLVAWHLLALAVTIVAVGAAVMLVASRDGRAMAPSVVVVAAAAVALLIGERMMVSVQERVRRINAIATLPADQPYRPIFPGYNLGLTVDQYRQRSYALDDTLTVITPGFADDRGWRSGILTGNGNLVAGLKVGYGSLAVWHKPLSRHWGRDFLGATGSPPSELLRTAGGTSEPWIEVLASDRVVLQRDAPRELHDHFGTDRNWRSTTQDENWVEYQRLRRLPGRITVARDVKVSDAGWTSGLAYAGRPHDTYRVSTAASHGSLVLRIPYWPGFRATLDGKQIPVSSLDESVLKIDVPPRVSDAELEIFYEPIGATISTPASLLGVGIIAAAASAMPILSRRRRGTSQAPSPR